MEGTTNPKVLDPTPPSSGHVLQPHFARRNLRRVRDHNTSPLLSTAQRHRPSLASDQTLRRLLMLALAILAVGLATQCALKAAQQRSALVRWRASLLSIVSGENIYTAHHVYPNPPIMALILHPLGRLPVVPGALIWFSIKVALAVLAVIWSLQLVCEANQRMPAWTELLVVGLSLRPIISDLQHGNVNLWILFLVVASLRAFRSGRDGLCGLTLALAAACKVTPALLCIYFLYKRAWKATAWCTLGLALFLFVLPALVLGPRRNFELLVEWGDLMVLPYAWHGQVDAEQTNQSIPGVLTRLLTDVESINYRDHPDVAINVASLSPQTMRWVLRGTSLALLALLAWVCRTPIGRRDRWRLSCEYALVMLAMLFLSERSWKHHYVTLVVPYAVLGYAWARIPLNPAWKGFVIATLAASVLFMLTTSREIGPLLFGPLGHKYAQGFGAFLLAGLFLFVAIAALLVRRPELPESDYTT